MEQYLKEISSLCIPAPEVEKELWHNYKKMGCTEARQELIKIYQPFVFKMVKQINYDRELDLDLIQEGNIGLITAVDSYDPGRGVKFISFAAHFIRGRILDYLKKGVNKPVFQESLFDNQLEERVEKKYVLEKIKGLIEELPLKEKEVIKGIYLKEKKAEILAAEIGISTSYLYRLQKKAVRRLRGKLSSFIKYWH
ncbi:MAG: sigma-70 family RNA polymerase sigma factor [Halanaerobiaceae bacterium]|nr:sigma-70 family RNA polymerase sigma factor [Halanaerobiaceae bacterium]